MNKVSAEHALAILGNCELRNIYLCEAVRHVAILRNQIMTPELGSKKTMKALLGKIPDN